MNKYVCIVLIFQLLSGKFYSYILQFCSSVPLSDL